MDVQLFDSTLRDGTQSEGLSLSVEDKLKIARLLDGFGIHYIEGGYPGSNPKDVEFFQRAKSVTFKPRQADGVRHDPQAGRPRRRAIRSCKRMVEAEHPGGRRGRQDVDCCTSPRSLGTTLEENLAMVGDSVAFLKQQGREVVFDAEHFFDGFRADRDYALAVVKAAADAGADWIAHVRHQRRQPAELHRRGGRRGEEDGPDAARDPHAQRQRRGGRQRASPASRPAARRCRGR